MNVLLKAKYSAPIALLLILSLLSLTACSGTVVVSDVSATITVIEGVLPLVLALVPGGAPFVAPVEGYLQAAAAGLDQVTAILQQGGTTIQIAEKITTALAAAIAQAPGIQGLLSGVPFEIATALNVIIGDIASILLKYGTPALTAKNVRAAQVTQWKCSRTDLKRLVSAHLRCEAILHQLPR
jgi:hypothetical protein